MLEGFPERCTDVHRSDIHDGVFVAHFYTAIYTCVRYISSAHTDDFDCEHYNKLINSELSIRFGYFHRMPILTHPAIGSIQRGKEIEL